MVTIEEQTTVGVPELMHGVDQKPGYPECAWSNRGLHLWQVS